MSIAIGIGNYIGNNKIFLPDWFKKSLVCWYSPKRLGLTGEDIDKKDGTYILKDLNPNPRGIDGKKCDMTLYGFNKDLINNGVLTFEGKLYGECTNAPDVRKGFTLMYNRLFGKDTYRTSFFSKLNKDYENGNYNYAEICDYDLRGLYKYVRIIIYGDLVNKVLLSDSILEKIGYLTNTNINGKTFKIFDKMDDNHANTIHLGFNIFNKLYWTGTFSELLLFDKELSEDQINWVKINILGEQPVLLANGSLLLFGSGENIVYK